MIQLNCTREEAEFLRDWDYVSTPIKDSVGISVEDYVWDYIMPLRNSVTLDTKNRVRIDL